MLFTVYPRRCPVCGIQLPTEEYICAKCAESFPYKYHKETLNGLTVYSVCGYNELTKNIVLGAKNQRDGDKLDFIAYAASDMMKTLDAGESADGIVPVPQHISKYFTRGYSHTEKISRQLSRHIGIPVINAVKKGRATAEQKSLSHAQRKLNLKGVFYVKENADIKGKRLIVFDDVCTTGATLLEVCACLKEAGCKDLVCVCFARAGKEKEDKA